MAVTITGTGATFTDGSTQTTGTYTYLDTQNSTTTPNYSGTTGSVLTVTTPTVYAIGHYLLIENQSNGSYTVAVPLNGWDSSTYASPVWQPNITYGTAVFGGTTSVKNTAGICHIRQSNALGGATALSGTWRSRGGNLICFLVQRVA